MFEVRCQGCDSPFEVDERRVPRGGMQMRCPKCNTSFLVKRPTHGAATATVPGIESSRTGTLAFTSGKMPVGVPSAAARIDLNDAPLPAPARGGAALPAVARDGVGLPTPRAPDAALPVPKDLDVGLPLPKAEAPLPLDAPLPLPKDLAVGLPAPRGAAPKPAEPKPAAPRGFADDFDLDLPVASSGVVALPTPADPEVALPESPDFDLDLPSPSGVGLPAPSGIALPAPSGVGLPARQAASHTDFDADFDVDLPLAFDDQPALPSPSEGLSALPVVHEFAAPPSPRDMNHALPTGAGYVGAHREAGSPRATMDISAAMLTRAATPSSTAARRPPPEMTEDDEADLPLALGDDLPVSVDFPASPDALPVPVDLPLSSDALPSPGVDMSGFGPEMPGLEPDSLPPVYTSPTIASKEGARLGRIGLERKAFTVSNADDLPAPSPGAALPTTHGRLRRKGDDVDPEAIVRNRAAAARTHAPATPAKPAPTFTATPMPVLSPPPATPATALSPELPELTPPNFSDPPPGFSDAPSRAMTTNDFGDLDLGAMSADDAPPSFGFVQPYARSPQEPDPSLPPLENPFDPAVQSVLPPAVNSMQPAPVADLLGSFDSNTTSSLLGDSLMPPPPASPTLDVTTPSIGTDDKGASRFGAKKAPLPPPDASPSRFRNIKPTHLLYGTLGFVAFVVVGGAALALTPYGAFGKNWIDEALHGEERLATANRVIHEVERRLEKDTYEGAVAALRRLDQAVARVPQVKELQAYLVYANNMVVARFGADPTRTGRARQVLAQLAEAPPGTRYLELARASDALTRGNARDAMRIARRDSGGRDLATLAAERLGDVDQWLRVAREGRQRHPSARSRYFLARAASARGDHETARRESEEVLRIETRHAGARILLARVLSRQEGERERALELLRDLVATPARGAAARAPGASGASVDERAEANVVAGQIELSRDHVTAAQARFQRALELDPRSASALVGVGQILFRQGNFADAQARFRNAYGADHNNVEAVVGIAQASIALGQAPEAKAVIEPAVREHPTDGRLQYWLGRSLAATTDQRTLAVQAFRDAIRLQPENLDAYVALSEVLLSMQRPDAADQVLLEARARVPESSAIHRALAHGRLARGDLAGSEAELRLALQRDPRDIRAHFALGDVLRRMQRLDDAQREFEAVAQSDTNYPGLAMARGQLAEARGELPQALQTFREALARDPTSIELIVRVAATLVALGNYNDADQMLRTVVVDQPTHGDAQYFMGRARLGVENFTDAMHYFDRAIELNPQRADYKAYAAEAHRRAGDIQRALQLAVQSIELDAAFPRGYWVRAEILLHRGSAQEALADINRATQLDPRFWAAFATWADIDDALGRRSEAIRLYRFALSHDERHGQWHYNLGRLLADQGDESEARTAFQRARAQGASLTSKPAWYVQATRALADIEREHRNRDEAQRLYTEYLRLVPQGSAAYNSAALALTDLLRD